MGMLWSGGGSTGASPTVKIMLAGQRRDVVALLVFLHADTAFCLPRAGFGAIRGRLNRTRRVDRSAKQVDGYPRQSEFSVDGGSKLFQAFRRSNSDITFATVVTILISSYSSVFK
jgi:hypothetical protein